MNQKVRLTLSIEVSVDDEFSPGDHAQDIVAIARKMFGAAHIDLVDIGIVPPPECRMQQADRP
ncbi:hypothetical protein [Aquamicrobium terrae]|uniref:Uncharacterized protein n=1 Tax=Aquamicrobium terrae TaxID=1324945 RepID=A0ABV2N064_9HYPH